MEISSGKLHRCLSRVTSVSFFLPGNPSAVRLLFDRPGRPQGWQTLPAKLEGQEAYHMLMDLEMPFLRLFAEVERPSPHTILSPWMGLRRQSTALTLACAPPLTRPLPAQPGALSGFWDMIDNERRCPHGRRS